MLPGTVLLPGPAVAGQVSSVWQGWRLGPPWAHKALWGAPQALTPSCRHQQTAYHPGAEVSSPGGQPLL